MEAWIFTHPDTWTRADSAPVWEEGEDDDAFMSRLGYRHRNHARNSDLVNFVGSWTLFISTAPEPQYAHVLIIDSADDTCALVWLPTLPDLLAYMARYGEIGQADWHAEEFDELARAVKLMFRAWHGHDSSSFCQECDPRQYDIWRQRQAERRAAKNAAVAAKESATIQPSSQ